MQPKAIRNQAMARGSDGLLRFETVDAGREFVLDPLAELIWDLCDGSRNVEALAQAAGRAFDRVVHREEVFAALDFLADAGLLEERVAPPAAEGNVSRRSLLTRIAPVVGATAWMMTGVSARAGGLFQYNESNSKESSNKAAAREAANKESGNKAATSEANNKESGSKAARGEADNKERDNKEYHQKFNDQQDSNRQQDAEKQRKSESQRSWDRINESERKHAIVAEQLEQKMRASWPKLYDLVGHKLSEFPELRLCWEKAVNINTGGWGIALSSDSYSNAFERAQFWFGMELRNSAAAEARFAKAGFDLPNVTWPRLEVTPPVLAGDSQEKTHLILEHIQDPAINDNWRYALDADNLRFEFADVEAAYQFLSSRRAAGTRIKK